MAVTFTDITPGTLMDAWGTPVNIRLAALRDALNNLFAAVGGDAVDEATAAAAALGIAGVRELVVKDQVNKPAIVIYGANDSVIKSEFILYDKNGAPITYINNAGAGLGATDRVFTQRGTSSTPQNLWDIYGTYFQNGIAHYSYPGPPGNMLSYRNALHELFDGSRAGSAGDWTVAFGSAPSVVNQNDVGAVTPAVPSSNYLKFSAASTSMTLVTGTSTFAYPVSPSTVYSTIANLRAVATARSPQVGFQWFDGSGAFLSEAYGSTTATSTSAWTKVTSGGITSHASAAFGCIAVKYPTTVAAEQHLMSGAGMWKGTNTSWAPPAAASPMLTAGQATAGDGWWRSDTPSTSLQRLYVCTTGGLPHQQVWAGIA